MPNDSFRCVQSTCVAYNQTVRAKYNQGSIFLYFLPDDMNKAGDTGLVTERRFHETMLDLTVLQDGAPAHKATETQDRL